MAKSNFIDKVFGKKDKPVSSDTAACRAPAPKKSSAKLCGSKLEYRREYDRLAYAKRTGKISSALYDKKIKAAKREFGIA